MGGATEQMAQMEARVERLENLESIRDSLHRYEQPYDLYGPPERLGRLSFTKGRQVVF